MYTAAYIIIAICVIGVIGMLSMVRMAYQDDEPGFVGLFILLSFVCALGAFVGIIDINVDKAKMAVFKTVYPTVYSNACVQTQLKNLDGISRESCTVRYTDSAFNIHVGVVHLVRLDGGYTIDTTKVDSTTTTCK